MRVCAIEALGRIGPEAQAATAGLIERLHEEHASVRSAAARTLGRSARQRKRPCPTWRNCGTIRKHYVRHAADEALEAISGSAEGKPR